MKQDKNYYTILWFFAVAVALFFFGWCFGFRAKTANVDIVNTTDTVTVTQIVRDTVLRPIVVRQVRIDTVWLSTIDTVKIPILIPIEQKTYQTNEYKAIIEGWRPSLIEMEVYRETQYITNTQTRYIKTKPRFGLGVQAGAGFNGQHITPYVGVGFQYNLVTF